MSESELSERNFKKIFWLNILMTIPILLLFSWPYYEFSKIAGLSKLLAVFGSFAFSLPFTLTVQHGYVTKSLGTLHRNHYYEWLKKNPTTYGLIFPPMFASTRFRLILFIVSIILLVTGTFMH